MSKLESFVFACLIAVLTVCCVHSVFADSLVRDGEGQKILAPAWNAALSQAITSNISQNLPVSGMLFYEFQPAADCQARLMNTTVKASWVKFTIKANTPFRGSNDATVSKARTVYLNLSGCTGDFRGH